MAYSVHKEYSPNPYFEQREDIEEYFFNHKLLYAAYFKEIEPGTYIIWIDINKPASVVIKSAEITVIDWRAYSI
jgi:hypothetical protein